MKNINAAAWSGAFFALSVWAYADAIACLKLEPSQTSDGPTLRHHMPMILSSVAFTTSHLALPAMLSGNDDGAAVTKALFVFYWALFVASLVVAVTVCMLDFAADTVTRHYLGAGVALVLQPILLIASTLAHLGVRHNGDGDGSGIMMSAME